MGTIKVNPDGGGLRLPKLRPADLQEQGLLKLNRMFNDLADQLAASQEALAKLQTAMPVVAKPGDPPGPDQVLTVGEGDRRYHPAVTRQALVNGIWSATGERIQPIPLAAVTPATIVLPPGPPPPPPSGGPGPGQLCAVQTNGSTFCYNGATLGARNVQSFFWFQQQIAVGAGNPWDFGCINGATFQWPQISQMQILNGIPSPFPSWPANYLNFGFIGAGTPPYEPPGTVWFIHSLSVCGGFDA